MAKASYEVLAVGTTFTQLGPSPERLLLRTSSLKKAQRFFDETYGNRVLVEIYAGRRTKINHALL
jgi:hypothetical protein